MVPIATGSIGVALSEDGLVWERACGPGAAGECFGPRDGEAGFDASHVGVGDVTRVGDHLTMLYFGGGSELRDMGGGKMLRGVGMCVGSATSSDGVRWTRQDAPLLQPTAGEQMKGKLDPSQLKLINRVAPKKAGATAAAGPAKAAKPWARK